MTTSGAGTRTGRRLGVYLALGLLAAVFLYPVALMFLTAFKSTPEIFRNPFGLPEEWNLLTGGTFNNLAAFQAGTPSSFFWFLSSSRATRTAVPNPARAEVMTTGLPAGKVCSRSETEVSVEPVSTPIWKSAGRVCALRAASVSDRYSAPLWATTTAVTRTCW